ILRGEGPAGRAVLERRPVMSLDVANDPAIWLQPQTRERIVDSPANSGLSVPLVVNERVTGAMTIFKTTGTRFTDDDIAIAEAFADQAGLALERARLMREAEEREEEATKLYEVSLALLQSLDTNRIVDVITEKAQELLGFDSAAVIGPVDGG